MAAESPPRRRRQSAVLVLASAILAAALIGWIWRRNIAELRDVVLHRDAIQQRLAEAETLATVKDSLYDELLETTAVMSDIANAVGFMASGRPVPVTLQGESRMLSARAAREVLLPRLDSLKARLSMSDEHLAHSLERMRVLSKGDSALRTRLRDFERTITRMTAIIAGQKEQLTRLDQELTTLRSDNLRLVGETTRLGATTSALADTVATLRSSTTNVYWLAGSKRELLDAGVVVEEGKGKVLIFGKGKTLQPARELDPKRFATERRDTLRHVTLPRPDVRYRLLTRQDGRGAEGILDAAGHVRGALTIRDPDTFWAPSPFLILVEDP